ncbi:ABC transporter permease [Streptomyces sp. I05A-00742]|uniref:ABC transporter permease n=1 Tax=Streptomyces sp. I05A-00742 TaxID=2732853 RepID=UPI001487EB1B|nr:ABC transporter permease [Streptomyces sp. I05A-00742]
MTSTSTPAPPVPVARRSLRPRGIAWLVLRQHRATFIVLALLLVVDLGQLLVLRWLLAHEADSQGLARLCADIGPECVDQWSSIGDFRSTYGDALHFNGLVVQYVPLLAGLFTAGPMVARELENGTWKLAWTQSVSPVRWLAAKLAVPAVLVLTGVSLLSAVYTWCWAAVPPEVLPGQRWYDSFGMLGPMPVADALLGVALGALAALLTRRTVAAMVLTLVGYGLVRSALGLVRPYLLPRTRLTSLDMPAWSTDGWVVDRGMLTRSGERVWGDSCDVGVSPDRCLAQHGADRWYLDYHPTAHHWPLAWMEAGLLAVLAALAAWAAVRWLRRGRP